MNCLVFDEKISLDDWEIKQQKFIKRVNFKALKDKLIKTNIYNTIEHKNSNDATEYFVKKTRAVH